MSAAPLPDWSNTRLVAECLAGNERAWAALLERYKNLIYSIPLRYGTPHQDAADIFQAVCLDLFNELPRLRDAEALQGWLIRVTTHKCYHWRRRQYARENGVDDGELGPIPSTDIIAPELLAGTYYYARLFPDASGRLVEESDRYAQALLYQQLARDCFTEAKRLS